MHAILRRKAVELRLKKELSYGEIRKRLGVSKSTLSYWLKDFPLAEKRILELRRLGWQKGEVARERFRNTMRKKREEKERQVYDKYSTRLSRVSKEAFFAAGLMLYQGEGNKRDPYRIVLANTDSKLITFFIKWLEQFLGVAKKHLKVQLHLYNNMNIPEEIDFWKNKLGLLDTQFYKSIVRKMKKNSFSYRESFRHGTCQISFSSGEKKRELMMAIKAFGDIYLKRV